MTLIIAVGTIQEHVLEYNWVKNEIKRKKAPNTSGKGTPFPASNIREGCEILLTDSTETRKMSTSRTTSPTSKTSCPERRAVQKDLAQIAASNEKESTTVAQSDGKKLWTMSEKMRWLYCYQTEQETQGSSSMDDTSRWKAFSKCFKDEFGVEKDNIKCQKQVSIRMGKN